MKPLMIVGAGGLAKEIYCILKRIHGPALVASFLGFVDRANKGARIIDSFRIIGDDDYVLNDVGEADVVVAQGFPEMRKKLHDMYSEAGKFAFPNIIDPSVIADFDNIELGQGNILFPGCLISPGAVIGDANLINATSFIAHDVAIGNYSVVNPGANVSGEVTISDGCLLGSGCIIHQGVTLARKTVVGLGAVVTRNTREETTYIGNPAKKML